MGSFEALVEVQLRPGISDPQGATIERALPALGFSGVRGVRAGKAFRLYVDAPDDQEARRIVEQLSERLLANPVIEESELSIRSADVASNGSSVGASASPSGSSTGSGAR